MARPSRAAFVGGPLHGRMMLVPSLDESIYAPASPEPSASVTRYVRQDDYQFEKADTVPTALYFTEGLHGRSVEDLQLDLLWPEGWAYTDA